MRVHLEGMGLQGALLAHRLALDGVSFTWHDIDAPHTAWKASTGAIYPAGAANHGPDEACYNVWKAWYENGYFDPSHLERSSAFVFCTKNPPHKGTYEHEAWAGNKLRAGLPSFHLNGQTFVEDTRRRFQEQRTASGAAAGNHDVYVVTHGWGARFDHAYWGWTRLVELDYEATCETEATGQSRPAFYFRPDRFSMAYAYPVPGTPFYYAGSSIIKQKKGKLKGLEYEPKYERWKKIFEREGEGFVKVKSEAQFLVGWRPAAAKDDEAWVKLRKNVITMRPLWNSGIRHFPNQWHSIALCLGLIP